MVLVRRIHNRGANIVVEAHGEVLFAPTGPVGLWTNRFSNTLTRFAEQIAPANKRPRWAHYGKPLKSTFTSSTTYQPGRMKVYAASGSTAPYAAYVDQGTGVYGGNGAYEAKILPPWHRGSPSLYEASWRPQGPGRPKVAPVMIRGQQGQFFFDKALARTFAFMRMRAFQVPVDARISDAIKTAPASLTNFLGNTPVDGPFIAQLEQWREWRDAAWRGEAGAYGAKGLVRRRWQTAMEAHLARQAENDMDLLKQGRGRAAYRANTEAMKARRERENAEALAAAERRRAAAQRKAEAEARERLHAGNAMMRYRARSALKRLKQAYPDARLAATTLPDGVIMYTIRYTGPDGVRVDVKWAYGYTD